MAPTTAVSWLLECIVTESRRGDNDGVKEERFGLRLVLHHSYACFPLLGESNSIAATPLRPPAVPQCVPAGVQVPAGRSGRRPSTSCCRSLLLLLLLQRCARCCCLTLHSPCCYCCLFATTSWSVLHDP